MDIAKFKENCEHNRAQRQSAGFINRAHERSHVHSLRKRGRPQRRLKLKEAKSIINGRNKIEMLVLRGLKINSKPTVMKKIIAGVRNAIHQTFAKPTEA